MVDFVVPHTHTIYMCHLNNKYTHLMKLSEEKLFVWHPKQQKQKIEFRNFLCGPSIWPCPRFAHQCEFIYLFVLLQISSPTSSTGQANCSYGCTLDAEIKTYATFNLPLMKPYLTIHHWIDRQMKFCVVSFFIENWFQSIPIVWPHIESNILFIIFFFSFSEERDKTSNGKHYPQYTQ